ncbi:non-ribosomal peptide synthetase, partial [Xanthomonas albilineans]|uniref:non-ribosomal peptide synthetase n=1 Tax=Xanthomonas albilineans TaxID=29447 RepID=UPI0005F34B92
EADPLPPLPIQYADYASWQRQWLAGEVLQQQAAYWREALSGAPVLLELPTDRPRPPRQDHAGATLEMVVEPQQLQALKELSQRHGLTMYMTLLASWALLLSRLSGQDDVVIGSPVANRGRSETEGLIGFFVNTLALRVEVSGSPTLAQLLASVKERALQAQAHQDIPFEQVVELVQPPRSLAHAPLFQVMFSWQNTPQGELDLGELEASGLGTTQTSAKFDLSLSLAESEEGIVGSLTYATTLFEHATLERWMGHWRHLLAAMLAEGAEDMAVDRLPLLGEAERKQVLMEWNATETDYPRDACVHELFEAQVARDPSAIAVVQGEVSLTYGELNARANRLAHYLRELGVRPADRMAICVQRSVEMVVALLAVLKAGGAYVPLDPAYPPERLTYILADCDAIRVLAVKDTILPERLEVLRVNIDDAAVNVAESDNPRLYSHGSTSAYVMYTSGSTGLPKGVEIPHRGINRLVLNNGYLPFHPSDRVAFAANPSFDATTLEVWGALLNGARMIVIEADVLLSQVRLAETIKCEGITILLLAAGLFHQYADSMKEAFGHLRYLLAGGDAIDPSVVAKVLDGDSPQHFLNCYGPTEITTIATTYEVVEIDDGLRSLPIGRPIANTQIYILDGYGTPVPIGVVGELYLGGDGVARGYLNREELTAERFLTDPFSADPTARMYRSGDLGRWCADGTIEFVGRNDHQVKIRGFRIELGEIEARLSAHAQVRECVVVALDADAGNDKRLVAYWVGAEDVTSEHLCAETLRSWLSDVLPDYMVPAAYVQLDRLPLTPNGKLDRKALPAPDGAAYAARAYEAPQGAIEQAIATIWSDLLGLETIGRHDNFFALGGHSLLAVRVASRLRQELGAEIGVAELFAHATLQRLAACVASSSAAVLSPILPLEPDAPRVLSFAQQRLWFLSQFEGVSQAYHISGGLRLRGALDTQALQRALNRIVARHASLRTTFVQVDGQTLQQIAAENNGFQLIAHDLRDVPDREAKLKRLLAEEAQAPFSLEHGPLIRGVLVQLAHDEYVLFVTMHHIVSDGWSMGILINELSMLYRAFANGEADPLPPLPIQYADYASWQRQWLEGDVLQQQATYWCETLSGAPVLLELPTDRPRPARQEHAGATLEVVVGPQHAQALKALSQRHGLTLYMTLLASWALLLSRLSGQDDVVIGSPVANRGRSETEGLIGFFVNTLALRVELSGSPTLAQLLASVKERALQAQAHQDIPFEQVVELVQPPRSLSHAPLFQVMFAWQNTPEGDLDLGELDASGLGVAQTSAQFDLSLSLAESEEGIVGTLIYATALFEHATLERWMGHWRYLLAAMVAEGAEDMAVDRLPLLDEAERHQVLMEWNATAVDYPRDACVHELFEAQVARDPSAIAVVQGEVSLTYGELNTGSNRLAHYLRELGVVPDDRVAICVQRSVEMVVAVLAVLKAGGAYVPLDPAYPPERLAYMHADCGAVAVLTDAASRSLVECSATSALIVDLQADSEHWEHLPDSNPVRHANGLTARHLVYVIYTSGSTGAPKGVMVSHHALTTCLHALIDLYRLGPQDRILQFAALAFDASVEELFGALCSGATLVLRDDTWLDTERFWPQCAHAGISVIDLPTRFWAQLCAQSLEIPACVRQLIIGGEALTPAMRQHWVQGTRMPLLDTYGPTEAVVVATAQAVAIDTPSGIGRPLAATRAYVLDRAGQPLPIGARGELHLAGAAMARGYLGRPDLTAERFVPDPFAAHPGARMYRTGDLGRWRADGTIEFLGRNDHQVKIRGFRIELGEIEARLSTHADVRECVVVTLEEAGSNEKRLVAYWVGAEGVTSEHLGAEDLRSLLSDVLPDYMVPAAYVQLDRLPLTPNGKLDRKALPAPDGAAYAARAYEAPQGAIEQAIATIWSDLLGLETIGRHDNFFALGGHSLLAVRVASRLRQELGAEIGVAELFAHATPQRLAACVASSSAAVLPPILPLVPDAPRVLSFAQQRLWFLSQFEGVSQAYHISGGLRLRGALDTQALQRTLDRIVARHASLRTTFALVDGQALQQIAAEDSGFQLIVHDLRDMPEREAALEQLLAEEAQAPFALEHGPLIRGVLVQLSHDEHVLFVTMHHIVSDGWSMGILINELSALYRAFAHGESDPLKPLPIQYADYASWQRQWLAGEVLQQQATYWRETLSGVPVLLELPTDRPRPPRQDHAGATLEVVVEPQQLQALKELSQRHGLTLYMTLLASWALLLSRLSCQDDVVIGSPVANRGRSETEGLIGFFVNTLALRVELSGSPTLAQLLASVKERALQAQAHQDIPFEQVVELVQPPRSLSHAPLFQVMFAWQNTPEGDLDLGELEASGLGAARTSAQFDLSLSLAESEEGIVGSLTYATALFEHATLERWMGHWRHLLASIVAEGAEDMAVDRLPLLDEAERHQVLMEWNATAADYPRDACVHELFEAQVVRDPSAIAVVQGEVSLTYAELNARANRLAHYLHGLGVRPDDRVAICVQRSVEMVVAVVAVLKAGGAYVPLDPAYPPERLAYMHSDCGAVAVLTDAASRRLVECSATAAVIVDLQADSEHWAHLPDSNPDRHANGLTARHLAYVIYTSGSTGAPKGSMNEHRSVVNLALAQIRAFNVEKNSRVMQFSSLSFDAFASELLVSLFCGASLYIADPGEMLAGENLARILSEYQISHVTLPPSVLHNLPENPELPCLKTLVVAGEALSATIAKRWCQGRRLINAYGPTETTVCASVHECDASATGTPPIGRPISNVRIYILDTHGVPVPVGVVGELYIGGDGVARGYLNREDLTAERFLTDPFSADRTARIYRSGDLGRWRADGTIEFVGRNDHQVKIRGFRIELGEIEARLSAHADVRECVVVALEDATGSDKRLVAYWVGAEGVTSDSVDADALRSWLSAILPDYMVPAAYVQLDRLPLTPNGKLDRKALPAPDVTAYAARAYEAPQGAIEQTIAAIWRDLLGLETIGRHDNFFTLGGHSLMAVQVVSRLKQAGVEISIGDLFSNPVMMSLADYLKNGECRDVCDGLVPFRKEGSGSPLFLLYDGFCNVMYGRKIVEFLRCDIQVYGVEYPEDPAINTIQDMAAQAIEKIRRVQPSGPYHLAGWSFGGLVAYEMASQLIDAGLQVKFLGVFDTFHISTDINFREEIASVSEMKNNDILRYFCGIDGDNFEDETMKFSDLVGYYKKIRLLPEHLEADELLNYTASFRRNIKASLGYCAPSISIKLHLFEAAEFAKGNPRQSWQNILPKDSIRFIQVPGTHQSMMDSPNVEFLSEALSEALAGC